MYIQFCVFVRRCLWFAKKLTIVSLQPPAQKMYGARIWAIRTNLPCDPIRKDVTLKVLWCIRHVVQECSTSRSEVRTARCKKSEEKYSVMRIYGKNCCCPTGITLFYSSTKMFQCPYSSINLQELTQVVLLVVCQANIRPAWE